MTERARRLAAVWFADIVGYTDLSARDEDRAVRLVERLQSTAADAVAAQGGRVVKHIGDAVLAEFQSTDRAVRAALDLRDRFAAGVRSAGLGGHDLRVGVHVGEIITADDGDVYGDGVNAASRLQATAAPGEVRVSEDVWRQLRQRPEFGFDPRGEHDLKGLAEPLQLYAVRLDAHSPGAAAPAAAKAQPAAPRRSIAVLPFANMSRDPDNEYFSDGITETLLMTLTKLGDLKVISRTSVMTYKGSGKRVREIAEELGVATVLEGSVQRAGSRVRITAQLIEAETDVHLWADTYDRDLEDIFAIQSEVAEQIATSLKSALTPTEKARIEARPTDSVEAYQEFLRGRHLLARRTPETLRQAAGHFERAVGRDPEFALAWAGLADAYALLFSYSLTPVPDAPARSRAAVLRALELNPDLGEAHASLGLLAMHEWNWAESEREFQRATELNPGYSSAYHWYGNLLNTLGRFAEAIASLEHALELDPLSLPVYMGLGVAHTNRGDYALAEKLFRRVIELDPKYAIAHGNMVYLNLQRGRYDEALDSMEIETRLSSFLYSPDDVSAIRSAYEARGAGGFWESTLETVRSKEGAMASIEAAEACAQLGRLDESFTLLERTVAERHPAVASVHHDRLFEPLHGDPRYEVLLRKMGLA